jgi:hypothetical protein
VAGKTGRFFIVSNIIGAKTFLMIQQHTNNIVFKRANTRGRALQYGKKLFMFLTDLKRANAYPIVRRIKTEEGYKEEYINPYHFNETLKKPAYLDGKILYMGVEAGGIAINPNLTKLISTADKGQMLVKRFFNDLRDTFNKQNATFNQIIFVADYSLQDLYALINAVITPQRLETVFMEGERVGAAKHKTKETVLLTVIIVLTLALCAVVYMALR